MTSDYSYRFTVSLRFTHPSTTWEKLSEALGRSPEFSWNAGDQRQTPKGALLEGYRKETYACFSLANKQLGDLGDFLTDSLEKLESLRDFFQHLSMTGGEQEFFIGVFAKADMGFDLEPIVLTKMGDMSIKLSLCFYLPDDSTSAAAKPGG